MIKAIFPLALILVFCGEIVAAPSLPSFFSDHMVLQRDEDVSIWGTASPGSEVSIAFKGESAKVKADAEGKWGATIRTGAADGEGSKLTVASDGETVTIDDVLVGEVWFASGQSNMYFTMDRVPDYADLIAESDHPKIRMFNAPLVTAVEPQDDIAGQWSLCDPDTASNYSAVAFFFARKLHLELGIPIGVIKSAWGGKPVETFTSREALRTLPATKALVDATVANDESYDPQRAQKQYEKGDAMHVKLDHVGRGLTSRDGSDLARFEIAGADRVWHWADAKIVGTDTVVVRSEKVAEPAAVRYAWAANPSGANLVNSEGLPASVFRTDDWDDVKVHADQTAQLKQQQRRELAIEIKALVAQKEKLEPSSQAYRDIAKKQRELLAKFKSQ